MGIYIYFSVDPTKVEGDRWERAFEDAAKIGREGKLAKIEVREFEGREYYCQTLAEPDEEGIGATGDLITGNNMEIQFFPRRLEREVAEVEATGDILVRYLAKAEEFGLTPPSTKGYLGNKTQGRRGHIWLLAMACVFCDAFPDATILEGDITAGQVLHAVRIAEDVLGRELRLPVAYDMEQLFPRVQEMAKGDELLSAQLFFKIYRGLRKAEFNQFVRDHFSDDTIYTLYRTLSQRLRPNKVMREWLGMDRPFKELARMLVVDPEGPRMEPVAFVGEVLMAKLHVKEKCVYNALEADNAKEEPDDVEMQFSRIAGMLDGLMNWHIDCYIPLEELKSDCGSIFENVDIVFDEAQKRVDASEHYKKVCQFYEEVTTHSQKMDREERGYDFVDEDTLCYWERPENSILPDLLERLLTFMKSVQKTTVGSVSAFQCKTREERLDEIIMLAGTKYGLPDTLWNELFARIMDDGFMSRYIGLLHIDAERQEISKLVNLFLHNAPLFEYIWNKATEE